MRGDIAIVDGYAFEVDRSVPQIGKYIGLEEELVFPSLNVSTPVVAENLQTATFTITAKEEKNGISKIEILQNGDVIKEYPCDNVKEEITIDYVAKQNGKYTVKVYAELSATKIVKVDGLIMAIEYSPNGSEEYKKEHAVKLTVEEEIDKVKSIKYQWLDTTAEPGVETFIESCNNNDTIIGKDLTGTYYLWTLLETESGKTSITRSEGFNFDNEGPNITSFSVNSTSATGITLNVTAQDSKSGLVKYEFYVDNLDDTPITKTVPLTTSNDTQSIPSNVSTGTHTCYVIAYDALGNSTKTNASGRTQLYTWARYDIKYSYKEVSKGTITQTYLLQGSASKPFGLNGVKFDSTEGYWTYTGQSQLGAGAAVGSTALISGSNGKATAIGHRKSVKRVDGGMFGAYEYTVEKFVAEIDPNSASQGTKTYSNVTNALINAYPSNGKGKYSDNKDYWFVYKGTY